jgi:hypothetical protein
MEKADTRTEIKNYLLCTQGHELLIDFPVLLFLLLNPLFLIVGSSLIRESRKIGSTFQFKSFVNGKLFNFFFLKSV